MKKNVLWSWTENESSRISRYIGSGVVNTLVGFFVILLAMAVGFSPVISNIFGYAVGFFIGFVLSKNFVFRSNGHYVTESIRYLVAFSISFGFNLVVLKLTLHHFSNYLVTAQIIAAGFYSLLMYLLTRLFVFAGSSSCEK